MFVQIKKGKRILLRKIVAVDYESLSGFLQNLSTDSKRRFQPHPFDYESIYDLYGLLTVTPVIWPLMKRLRPLQDIQLLKRVT